MIGRRFTHYRIVEPLDEGGMGVVYRGWDEHLEREVAIKLLPEDTLADEATRKRFRREALALSRLNHPHINAVYDFDRSEGMDFIVMELVAGETLERRLARGSLPEAEVRRLGTQIASALVAAHEQGIVHRDLKPANVIIQPRGDAKVLDFGIAKRMSDPNGNATTILTEPLAMVGTLPYMAPEQVLGQEVDPRADLFSLGVMLYELATGRRPFHGETGMALANDIVNLAPEPLRSLAPGGVSADLETVILRCLEKVPAHRFATAHDLIQALGGAAVAKKPTRHRVGRILGMTALVAGAMLFVLIDPLKLRQRLQGTEAGKTIAVMPLENLSRDPDQEFFAEGMTEEITTALSRISALTVIAFSSTRAAKDRRLTRRELGRRLGVRMLVLGTVARAGERVRVNASLIDISSGRVQWSNSYARDLRNVFDLQSELALGIAREIQVRLTAGEKARLTRSRQTNTRAHEQYLLGLHDLTRVSAKEQGEAIARFERAVELDPSYAAAYAASASAYIRLSNWWLPPRIAMPRARAAAERALALDPDLAEAHAAMGLLLSQHDWQLEAALGEIGRAVTLDPSSAEARFYLGYVLTQLGRFGEGRTQLLKAVQLDPLNSFYRWVTAWPLFYSGRYADAVRELKALIRDDPKFADASTLLGETFEQMKDYRQALIHLKHGRELGMHAWGLAAIGRVYAEMGRRDSASIVIRQLEGGPDSTYVAPYGTATICAALGEKDRAFALLERAVTDRSEDMLLIKIDPRLAPLHGDRRFHRLVSRVGLD